MGNPLPTETRFLRHVDKESSPSGCWLWTGVKGGSNATYGYFRTGTRPQDPKFPAHRVAYELWVGPIPEGHEIDHVVTRGCTSTLCVNPAHLEPVTHAENRRRSRLATCRSGRHDLTKPENQRFDSKGQRRGCLVCWKESQARRVRRRRTT